MIAQDHGMRIMGARNMKKPVLIAAGGMTIDFRDTGTRVSRTRHTISTTPPKIGPTRKASLRTGS
jgi:hypothetical protein